MVPVDPVLVFLLTMPGTRIKYGYGSMGLTVGFVSDDIHDAKPGAMAALQPAWKRCNKRGDVLLIRKSEVICWCDSSVH